MGVQLVDIRKRSFREEQLIYLIEKERQGFLRRIEPLQEELREILYTSVPQYVIVPEQGRVQE